MCVFSKKLLSHTTQGQGSLHIVQHHHPDPTKCPALCSSQSKNINPIHPYKIVTVHNVFLICFIAKHFLPGYKSAVSFHMMMKLFSQKGKQIHTCSHPSSLSLSGYGHWQGSLPSGKFCLCSGNRAKPAVLLSINPFLVLHYAAEE